MAYTPEDIRSMREALEQSPSQATPAFAQALLTYNQALGIQTPTTTIPGGQLTWERDPVTGETNQRRTDVQMPTSLGIAGGFASSPGVVSSQMPDLEEQRGQILVAQNQRREAAQRLISGQFGERAEQLKEQGALTLSGAEARL